MMAETATSVSELRIEGSWRLSDCRLTYANKRVTRPLGNSASGYLFYAPDGHVCEMLNYPTRDGEIDCLSFFGQYQAVADRVFHYISTSADIRLVGTTQEFVATTDDDVLTLTLSPAPAGGPGSTIEYEWTRALPAANDRISTARV